MPLLMRVPRTTMGLGLPFPALLPRDAFAAPSNAAKQALNASRTSVLVSCGLPSGVFLLGRCLSAASQVCGILVVEKGPQGCFSCSNSV